MRIRISMRNDDAKCVSAVAAPNTMKPKRMIFVRPKRSPRSPDGIWTAVYMMKKTEVMRPTSALESRNSSRITPCTGLRIVRSAYMKTQPRKKRSEVVSQFPVPDLPCDIWISS